MRRRPPRSHRTATRYPYPTLFRSVRGWRLHAARGPPYRNGDQGRSDPGLMVPARPTRSEALAGGDASRSTIENYVRRAAAGFRRRDRKSVVSGKSVSVRVDLGGPRIIKKKNRTQESQLYSSAIIYYCQLSFSPSSKYYLNYL